MSNPVTILEEFNKKTVELEYEPSELSRNHVRDGYVLILKRNYPATLVEIDVFVFDHIQGAKEFYQYIKDNGYEHSPSKIGDEIAVRAGETSYTWIVRCSNAFSEYFTAETQRLKS